MFFLQFVANLRATKTKFLNCQRMSLYYEFFAF